jgi:uncharacterized protein YndB with AHSA1/START domain
MPAFHDQTTSPAPPEEVWKILYDPGRFPEWWDGIETVDTDQPKGADGDVTFYPDGYPDFPMPQLIDTAESDSRITVSCLVSDIEFTWHLSPRADGGTDIEVNVEIPEKEAARLDTQRASIAASLRRLAEVATMTV